MNKAIFIVLSSTKSIEKNNLNKVDDSQLIKCDMEAMEWLQNAGYLLIVITKESGLSDGIFREEDLDALSNCKTEQLHEQGFFITSLHHCSYISDAGTKKNRKDGIHHKFKLGVLEQTISNYDIDLGHSYVICDKNSKCEILSNTRCSVSLIGENEGENIVEDVINEKSENIFYAEDLSECAKKIILENLKESPMFNLSLSSKELFHSNFIHWLANEHAELFWDVINHICKSLKEDFPTFPENFEGIEFRRECEKFDFSVWGREKEKESLNDSKSRKKVPILVIENKVKSLANAYQLCEYEKKINGILKENDINIDIPKILLSLADYNPRENKWKLVTYGKFAEYLEESIENKTIKPGYHKSLIEDYIAFIKNLDSLRLIWKEEIKNNNVNAFLPNEEMKELRIDDIRQKIIYSIIEKALKEKLAENFLVLDSTKSKELKELNKLKELKKEEEKEKGKKKKEKKNSIIERIKEFSVEKPVIFTNTGYGDSAFVEMKFIVKSEIIKKIIKGNVTLKGEINKNINEIKFACVIQLQNNVFRVGIELLDSSIKFKNDVDFSEYFVKRIWKRCKFINDFCKWEETKSEIYKHYCSFENTFLYRNKKLKDLVDLEELKNYSLDSIVNLFINYTPMDKSILCTQHDILEMAGMSPKKHQAIT